MREASIDELLERIAVLEATLANSQNGWLTSMREREASASLSITKGFADVCVEHKRYKDALARCSKICSQTGLMAPDGDWARMQVIDTVEEALKEGV